MIRQWTRGVLSLSIIMAVGAQAQTQMQAPTQTPVAATPEVQQVLLPPLPGAQTATPAAAAQATTAAQTGTAAVAPQNAAANQHAMTPQQALTDPVAENQYFSESTYGTPRDPAFANMLKKMYPMSPEQIHALRDAHDITQRAMAAPQEPTPTPNVTSQSVNLSPGSAPPVLRLSTGYVSSVLFVDETGAPWPVSAYSIGDPSSFNIQWDQQSNLLLFQGQKPFATGNMAVSLQGMPTPVMLTIVTDQNTVDYRVDFRVPGRGPNAKAAVIASHLPQNANVVLMNLLEGIPPQDSELLNITGGQAQVWLWNNQLYVRTPLTLLSPGWAATMSSADGTHVYQLPITPMILASYRGESITLKVEGL